MAAAPSDAGFSLAFVDADGVERRDCLPIAWSTRFECVLPVRTFSSGKGQLHFPGAWWSATTGTHVGFESWLERDHAMVLDFDQDVVGFSSQPFWLSWRSEGRARRHAPDYFARLADGAGVVIDVRPDERITPRDAAVFAVTAAACESVGWAYRRVGVLDPLFAANVRWLAGYRHRRCSHPQRADRLRQVFAAPIRLDEGVRAAGDPLAFLPVLFHLLWTGALDTNMQARLGPASVISGGVR